MLNILRWYFQNRARYWRWAGRFMWRNYYYDAESFGYQVGSLYFAWGNLMRSMSQSFSRTLTH